MKLIKVRTTKNYRVEYWQGTLILDEQKHTFDIMRYNNLGNITRVACSDARFNNAKKFFSIEDDAEADAFLLRCFMGPFVPIGDYRYFCEHYYTLKIDFGDGFNSGKDISMITKEVI